MNEDGTPVTEINFFFTIRTDFTSRRVYMVFNQTISWLEMNTETTKKLIELLGYEIKELEKGLQ